MADHDYFDVQQRDLYNLAGQKAVSEIDAEWLCRLGSERRLLYDNEIARVSRIRAWLAGARIAGYG